MTTLPLWLAIYLSIGLSFALLCTASPARLRRNWQLARRGHPSYARCIGMVGIFMLFWPVLVVLAVRR